MVKSIYVKICVTGAETAEITTHNYLLSRAWHTSVNSNFLESTTNAFSSDFIHFLRSSKPCKLLSDIDSSHYKLLLKYLTELSPGVESVPTDKVSDNVSSVSTWCLFIPRKDDTLVYSNCNVKHDKRFIRSYVVTCRQRVDKQVTVST